MFTALNKYFGYTDFLPLQEEIIRDVLDGKDVLALMPTGGGKSLCYQLPALLSDGLTVVVSPLIALMKDQVDGLVSNGVPAAYINSSLSAADAHRTRSEVGRGTIKILYIAPERLAVPEFLEFLKGLNIRLFAVDEAHCISEWGHDFRSEYRQLRTLKQNFPTTPIIALTATATGNVQDDIAEQLNIPDCKRYRASFDRKNLHYRVEPKANGYQQLLRHLEAHKKDSGIIYCHSRKGVDNLSANLRRAGYRALPYHAGMTPEERSANQERFIKDDAEIIVATIAFGMGIDKPDVRYVIHYDLPRNIEGYYQETGRAGRDGLKSDCILFYSYGDKAKIEYFIRQKDNQREMDIAYKKLKEMTDYCEGDTCRRKVLLGYFGEGFDDSGCRACDICLEPREKFDGTIAAQKVLSCVYRVNGGFGVNHIIDVLLGSKNRKVIERGHDALTTYGVGREYSKSQWQSIIRELAHLGFLDMEGDRYPTLSLNEKSRRILVGGEQVFLTKPSIESVEVRKSRVDTDEAFDHELFEILRDLRKALADEEVLPPYVIFHDATLKEMAAYYPSDTLALANIIGVGEVKLQKYGDKFVETITEYCVDKGIEPKQIAPKRPARAAMTAKTPSTTFPSSEAPEVMSATIMETLGLCNRDLTLKEIAEKRSLAVSTIMSHIEKLVLSGEDVALDNFIPVEKQEIIQEAMQDLGLEMLRPIKERLGEDFSYNELRLVRAQVLRDKRD